MCLERLDRPEEAIAAFERFIDGTVDSAAIAETRGRIAALEKRKARKEAIARVRPPAKAPATMPHAKPRDTAIAPPVEKPAEQHVEAPPLPPVDPSATGGAPSSGTRFAAPIAVGVVALALVGVGAGLVGSVGPAYADIKAKWLGKPGPSTDLQAQAYALRDRERAGYALLGIGAARCVPMGCDQRCGSVPNGCGQTIQCAFANA